MITQKQLSTTNKPQLFVSAAVFATVMLALASVLIPQLSPEDSFAEGTGDTSAVFLKLSPTNTKRKDYYLDFGHPKGGAGSFGVVGINANVATANTYGYSLYMRSGNQESRMVHADKYFADKQYIKTISQPYTVTDAAGSTFLETNSYGWSTNWNPSTSRGLFKPMQTSDIRVKNTNHPTYSGDCDPTTQDTCGEDVQVYIGAKVNDQVMHGTYKGVIIFTAVANDLSETYDTYTLNYDLNGGTPDESTFAAQTITTSVEEPTATFTINTAVPTHPDDATFLGWDTDRSATTPTYAHNGAEVTPAVITAGSTNTTLYAIWSPVNNSNPPLLTVASPSRSTPTTPSTTEEEPEVIPVTAEETATQPLGEVTYETDNGPAAAIAVGVGVGVAITSASLLFLAKRKKDERDELNVN